jgi:hypothetical protein
MKRLIRKSYEYDVVNIDGKEYNVYKDPTANEVLRVRRQDSNDSIRGIIDYNGDTFIWAADVLHESVPVTEEGIHFNFEPKRNDIEINFWYGEVKEIINTFIRGRRSLQAIGVTDNVKVYLGSLCDGWDIVEVFNDAKNIGDIYKIIDNYIGDK